MNAVKQFTPKEANQTLPLVKRIVQDIQDTGKQLLRLAAELGPDSEDDSTVHKMRNELHDLGYELERLGCSYKDPNFELGLVDFPSVIDGEEVLLCWRSDEPSVMFYHGFEDGYSGRKPIPDTYLEP